MEQYLITMALELEDISFFDFTISIEGELTPEDIDDIKQELAEKHKIETDALIVMNIYKF